MEEDFGQGCDVIDKHEGIKEFGMKRMCLNGFVAAALFCTAVLMYTFMPRNAEARHCAAIIYEHANYRGDYQCLQEGSYNLGDIEIGNDTLSSIKVSRGNTVILYEHKNFSGRKATVRRNYSFVGDRWNDIVSSIIVE